MIWPSFITAIAITLFLPLKLAFAAPTCSEIFTDKPMPDLFLLEKHYSTWQIKNTDYGVSKNSVGILNQSFYLKNNLVTNVFSFSKNSDSPTSSGGLYPQKSFSDLVKENIDFVISTYQERRDWDASYRHSIYEDAFNFSEQAHYIMVHRLNSPKKSKLDIKGSLKVIRADTVTHTQLPLEVEHGIRLPFNGGRKFEPGNFVVSKKGSPEVYSELMLHFIDFAHQVMREKGHESNKMIFFTDADLASARMYRKLGFEAVPGFEAPLKKGDKEYYLIGASAETVAGFQKLFSETKKEWQLSSRSGYYSIAEASKQIPIQSSNRLLKQFNSDSGPIEVSIYRTEKSYSTKENKDHLSFSFWLGEGGNIIHQKLKIPYKELPLYEGWRSSNGRAEYGNGQLIIKNATGNGVHTIYLQVDAKLSKIQGLRFMSTDRNGNILDSRASRPQ